MGRAFMMIERTADSRETEIMTPKENERTPRENAERFLELLTHYLETDRGDEYDPRIDPTEELLGMLEQLHTIAASK